VKHQTVEQVVKKNLAVQASYIPATVQGRLDVANNRMNQAENQMEKNKGMLDATTGSSPGGSSAG